jgi:hypothetical protein
MGVVQPLAAVATPLVDIEAWATHINTNLVYHYKLRVTGDRAVGGWSLGYNDSIYNDRTKDHEAWEYTQLQAIPLGAELSGDDWNGGTFTTPGNWRAEIKEAQDTSNITIDWDANFKSAFLAPGQTAEFRVTVPIFQEFYEFRKDIGETITGYDVAYLTGDYEVWFSGDLSGGVPSRVTGKLVAVDKSQPSLAIKTSPASVSKASGTSLKVQALLTVSDDYDPQPEIKLESITASVPMNQSEIKGAVFGTDDRLFILPVKKDPTGKPVVYTVTYSAMDGTGNKATQSATVTLNP